jgi:hypothetical protein
LEIYDISLIDRVALFQSLILGIKTQSSQIFRLTIIFLKTGLDLMGDRFEAAAAL